MKIFFINERNVRQGNVWVNHPKFFDYSEESLTDLYKYAPGGEKNVNSTEDTSKVSVNNDPH